MILAFAGLVISFRDIEEREGMVLFSTAVLLYLYFLPWFYSTRIIEYLTPFMVYYFVKGVEAGYKALSRHGHAKAVYITLLVLALLLLTPMGYWAYLNYLKEMGFSYNGYVALLRYEDLKAVELLGDKPSYVISDPLTSQVLASLNIHVKTLKREPSLLYAYSYDALSKYLKKYDTYIVVNSRTFKWLSGSPDKPFIGFRRMLSANRTLERLVLGRNYYLFKLRRGVKPVVAEGPKLPVLTDKGLIDAPARMEYYEPFDARCYLTLNGSSTYRILRYPGNWVLVEVKVGRRKLPLPRDRDEFIYLSGFSPKDKVTLVWRANLLYNHTGYKESDFKDWVSFGSPTWSQIENLNLNVDLERYPVMILGVEGSRNAAFEEYLFLSDGRVVNVFGGRIKAPTSLAEIAVDFSPAPRGVKVSGIMFKSYSLDGKPYEFRIGYIIFARR